MKILKILFFLLVFICCEAGLTEEEIEAAARSAAETLVTSTTVVDNTPDTTVADNSSDTTTTTVVDNTPDTTVADNTPDTTVADNSSDTTTTTVYDISGTEYERYIPIYTSPEITSFSLNTPGSTLYSGDTITANIGVNVGTAGQFDAYLYIYNATLGGQAIEMAFSGSSSGTYSQSITLSDDYKDGDFKIGMIEIQDNDVGGSSYDCFNGYSSIYPVWATNHIQDTPHSVCDNSLLFTKIPQSVTTTTTSTTTTTLPPTTTTTTSSTTTTTTTVPEP